MSIEAVQKVTEAEERARAQKAAAVEQAKKLVADAERTGRERLEAAHAEAEGQVKAMLSRAEESAAARTAAVLEETRRSCDGLRRAAEDRLDDAAALIIRRVVGV